MLYRKTIAALCGAGLVLYAAEAFAVPDIDVIQDLRFGTYVLRPGSSAGATVTVTPQGQLQPPPSPAFIPVDGGIVQNGIIQMTDFDPDADLQVTVTFNLDGSPLALSCGPGFTVDTYTTDLVGGMVHTSVTGDAQIAFGARLTATGGTYNSNNCSETLPVSVVLDN